MVGVGGPSTPPLWRLRPWAASVVLGLLQLGNLGHNHVIWVAASHAALSLQRDSSLLTKKHERLLYEIADEAGNQGEDASYSSERGSRTRSKRELQEEEDDTQDDRTTFSSLARTTKRTSAGTTQRRAATASKTSTKDRASSTGEDKQTTIFGSIFTADQLGELLLMSSIGEAAPGPECTLVPGMFGVFVQVALGVFCFSSLIVKWQVETPPIRPGIIFARDSSKQILGGCYMHSLNMLAAIIFATKRSAGDECDWYWVNIMIDCTLGTLLNCFYLRRTESWFGYESGVYEDSPRLEAADTQALNGEAAGSSNPNNARDVTAVKENFCTKLLRAITPAYRFQIACWLLVLTIMKSSMIIIFLIFGELLATGSSVLIDALFGQAHNRLKLLFVMVFTPTVMNIFQFWVSDSFLMASRQRTDLHQPLATSEENAA
ncbi:unnamed protein product [Amoebophrya sp. A25]|nr:unnamed protein product [Amoebophrya sp. A25]|eukprot:GSA25T00003221001.1